MGNTRFDRIIENIGKYYGVRDNVVPTGTGTNSIDVKTVSFSDSESDAFVKNLISKSKSAPLLRAIESGTRELGEEKIKKLPLLITPYKNLQDPRLKNITNRGKDETDQGFLKQNESMPFLTSDILSGDLKKISVFQCFSPAASAATVDTDIVSLFMRNAPSFSMSQAVPYLDVSIASAVANVPGYDQIDNTKNYTLLGRFLGKEKDSDLNFFNANFDPKKSKPRFDEVDELRKTGRSLSIIGGMESFVSPQTMVNANKNYHNTNGKVLDQFQPFMSLLSLKLSVVGQGGLMAYKSGALELMLHDRARLNEIGSLIAPDRFGNSRLIITYGWCHPSGKSLERGDYSGLEEDLIGELIDSMRVTEVFLISNSKFNFEQSSVKITLSISEIGSKVLTDLDVSMAISSELDAEIMTVKQELKDLADLLDSLNNERQSSRISTITVPSFLRNPDSITINHARLLKTVQDLKKSFTNKNSDTSKALSSLFGSGNNDENSLVGSELFKLVKNFANEISNQLKQLKSKPDPFLPVTDDGDNQANPGMHVSLGKIMTFFLGNAFNKKFGNNVEVQLFFHPFNHDAGRMNDYNISQFYLEWDDFEKVLLDQYSPFGFMSFGKLFNIIQQYFINDLAGPAYDFISSSERSSFSRNPEKLTARGKKVNKKFESKAFEEALEKNKSKKLKLYYYGNENDFRTANFKTPQLTLNVESFPSRSNWLESLEIEKVDANDPDTVVRIHIADRCCVGNYTVSDVLKSAPGRMFAKTFRKTRKTVYSSKHYSYAQKPLEILEKNGFIKSLGTYLQPVNGLPSASKIKLDDLLKELNVERKTEIQNVISNNYYIFNAPSSSVKNMIKSIHPSMDYGTLSTGIFRASVSSIDDSGLATIMLIRGGKGGKGTEGEENVSGVPMSVMPVSVSIETIGCPYFSFAQFYFIDFGTNTNIDNVYAVTSIDHTVEPGKFITSVKLTWVDSFAVFQPLEDSMREAGIKSILNKMNVFNN